MATNAGIGWRARLGVGAKQYDKTDILKGIAAFVAQIFIMTSGALLVNNQIELSKCDNESNKSLNYACGSILIIVASIAVLYSIFLLVRPPKA
jgi:hypothetical protein